MDDQDAIQLMKHATREEIVALRKRAKDVKEKEESYSLIMALFAYGALAEDRAERLALGRFDPIPHILELVTTGFWKYETGGFVVKPLDRLRLLQKLVALDTEGMTE